MQAKHLELYGTGYFLGEWGRGIAAWTDLPLVPFLQGLVFSMFGETRIAVQAFTTLLFSATVALTYLTGKTRRFIVSCAIASSLVTALFGFLPFLKGTSAMNLMRAGEYLDSLDVEMAEVITLPRMRSIINPAVAVPILDLFTGKRIVHWGNQEPPPARNLIETSPLRFTWEFYIPPYFSPEAESPGDQAALVVIASRNGQPLPPPGLNKGSPATACPGNSPWPTGYSGLRPLSGSTFPSRWCQG